MRKKLLHLWRRMTFRYINPNSSKDVTCLLINDAKETTMLNELFGVTKDRAIELMQVAFKQMQSTGDLGIVIHNSSKECKHQNELAMVCYFIGNEICKERMMGSFFGAFPNIIKE